VKCGKCNSNEFRLLLIQAVYIRKDKNWGIPLICQTCDNEMAFYTKPKGFQKLLGKAGNEPCYITLGNE
jgi:hypothetical protein